MEIDIVDKRDNPLLNRTEIRFRIVHEAGGTPARKAVREAISKKTNSPKERVVVDNMSTVFGKCETMGYAKVYKTKQDAQKIEKDAVKKRHGLVEAKKEASPKEGPAEEKKEGE